MTEQIKVIWKKYKLWFIILGLLMIATGYQIYRHYQYYLQILHSYPDGIVGLTKGTMWQKARYTLQLEMGDMFRIHVIMVILPGIYIFYKKIKSKIVIEELQRQSYFEYMVRTITSSWFATLIAPLFLLLFYLAFYIYTGGEISGIMDEWLNLGASPLPISFSTYIYVHVISLILIGIFYINIALIYLKKIKNLPLTLILTIITTYVLNLFSEIFLGKIIEILFNKKGYSDMFRFSAYWDIGEGPSIFPLYYFALLLVIISTFIVYLCYRKKERLIQDVEK